MAYTILFDTLCDGPQPVRVDDEPISFATEDDAQAEIDSDPEFYQDCFVAPITDIGRRVFFTEK